MFPFRSRRPPPQVPPYDFAGCARVLTDPALHGGLPSVIQHRWQHLKEARGQSVDLERLADVHHIIAPPAARPLPEGGIDAARRAALPATRAAIARLFGAPKGDGGGEAA